MNAKALKEAREVIEDEARKLGGKVSFFLKDHHMAYTLFDGDKALGSRIFAAFKPCIVRQDVRRIWKLNH